MSRVNLLCVWLVFFFVLFPFFFFNVAKNSPAKKFRVLAELSQVSVLLETEFNKKLSEVCNLLWLTLS